MQYADIHIAPYLSLVTHVMKKILFLLASLFFAASCSEDAEYTTEYQCFFIYDLNIHNTSIVNNAVNPASSGVFARVSSIPKNGLRCIVTELNDGKTKEQEMITTEIEIRQPVYVTLPMITIQSFW